MPRAQRAQSFLFEPARLLNDPAFLGMSEEARGCYAALLFKGWDLPEVGVYPADDRVLATLALTTPETWLRVREEISRAFDTESRPGSWVQNSLQRTYDAQTRVVKRRKAAAKQAAKVRWDKENDATRTA